jgi:hypothetical protein
MKTKLIVTLLAVLALSPSTFANYRSGEEQDLLESLSTPETAKAFLEELYRSIGSPFTVVNVGPFELRTLNGEDYLLAKAWVTARNGTQVVVGVVNDFNHDWKCTIGLAEFNRFLQTGNRRILGQPDLNLPSETPVPQQRQPDLNLSPEPQQERQDDFILKIQAALNDHDWRTITSFSQDGQVNYFGHRYSSNAYIIRDMENDASTYSWSHSTYYPGTFTHEISNAYSPRWNGPMIYDSINVYSEIQERHGRLHRALTRLTVGYTVEDGVITVYALALKVL